MKIKHKTPVYYDLETTGFSGFEDKLVSAIILDDVKFRSLGRWKEEDLLIKVMEILGNLSCAEILVSYNGENWRGGFDIPFLRSQCIKHNVEWTLAGIEHLDLLPIVKKRINTHHYSTELPSKSKLYKDDLVKLAKANDLEYTNKNDTYDELIDLGDNCDWLDYIKEECKEKNGLQTIYQLIFDQEAKEEYLSGGEVPEFYEAGNYDKIIEHNERDVIRLKKVTEAIINTIPSYELDKAITVL